MAKQTHKALRLCYTRLDSSKRLKDYFKASAIQGLIATSGLKAKGFFGNLIISLKEEKKKKHYYLERL